jgi:MarR family transcriptional regulator, organic hydroperoxide resistance regulator
VIVYDRIMNELLALFTRSSKLMRTAADEAMSRHGVRVGQNLLLEVLWETDGLTPGEVAGRLHVATPTVVKSANRMVAAGLLIRKRDLADARLVRLYLTDRARGVRRAVEQERDELERRMTATLTPDEREHLRSALIKIIAQLADSRGPAAAGGPESPGPANARGRLGGTAGPAPGVRAGVERATGQRRAVQPG